MDQDQKEVIETKEKIVLVTAGPGSGKTTTIIKRIEYLLKQNIKEQEILCLTFTKEAANHLKKRIKEETTKEIDTYTFHKLALEIIGKNKKICEESLLEQVINQFFHVLPYQNNRIKSLILEYFHEKDYKKIEKSKEMNQLEKLISTFIHLWKTNGYSINDFINIKKKIRTLNIKRYIQEKLLLIMIINIYINYQEILKEEKEVDFDDLIIEATKKIEKDQTKRKYIIVDEFQDTSKIRLELLNALVEKNNANLLVVGDDYQSIYQFTGCDINIFLNFNSYYQDVKIISLKRTYRNSNELIKIASSFIQKNKSQIKKELYSTNHRKNPIKIIYYDNIKEKILEVLDSISEEEILILGRNNKDKNSILSKNLIERNNFLYDKNNRKIEYMTIHKSKGLEREIIIVINLEDKIDGLPNQIKNEKILRLIKKEEKYPYSEERRLFFVSLTRTKKDVYLLVPKKNPSIFIKEIEKML